MTCSSHERICQFTEIPKGCHLSPKIERTHFIDYITHIMSKPDEYKFLSGWVTHKKSHSIVSSYLQKKDCVASTQYSPNCKIFVFLVNFVKPEWLHSVAIYTTTSKIELMFFLVHKKRELNEIPMKPQVVPVTSPTAFRLIYANNKIGLKVSALERIREAKRVDTTADFADHFAEEEDEGAKQEKQKPTNKLQFLIDQGDQIKKVPTFVIEEESKTERNRVVLDHFEEESINDDDDEVDVEPKGFGFNDSYMNSAKKNHEERHSNILQFGAMGAIDKEEFVRRAVSQIQIPIQTIFAVTRYLPLTQASH